MRILLIKMSSMGDVFHTFPALSDAQSQIPDLQVDWIVEKSFSEIPVWHSVVRQVYPIELRKWRRHPFRFRKEIKAFFQQIQQQSYDLILDAQGLLKSAWVIKKLRSKSVGLDWHSAREPLASFFYDAKIYVDKNQHAIWRLRELFAKALNYPLPNSNKIDYGLKTSGWSPLSNLAGSYVVFLHGTTWETKLWPEAYWILLATKVATEGKRVVLPWGTQEEHARAQRIALGAFNSVNNPQVWVPGSVLSINEMARCLKFADFVVSVDTGLSHVAAALDVPMVVLYRVTDPQKIGALGAKVLHLVSPVATQYIKKFQNVIQSRESLQGLQVDRVTEVISKI